jgi:hypothetical protein
MEDYTESRRKGIPLILRTIKEGRLIGFFASGVGNAFLCVIEGKIEGSIEVKKRW